MTPPPSPADLARPPGAWLPPPAPARSGPSGPGWPSSVAGASVVERLSDAAHASEARVERSRGVTSPAIARPASRTRPAGGVRQIRERSSGARTGRESSAVSLTRSLTCPRGPWSIIRWPVALSAFAHRSVSAWTRRYLRSHRSTPTRLTLSQD